MTQQRVLISGAGIAGLGLAHWLGRQGCSVVLIDRASEFTSQGHFMTLKGTCVEVLKAMGLFDEVRRHEWPSNEWDWYTHSGRCLRRVAKTTIDSTLSGFLSVRRTHLHQVLREALPASVDVRLGVEIEYLEQREDAVDAVFSGGSQEVFDIVVGADGVHSQMRRRHFPEVATRSLGGHYIVFVVATEHTLGGCTRTIWGPGRSVSLIPLAPDQLGMMIYQDERNPIPPATPEPQAWRSYLQGAYRDFPVWVRHGVAALADGDEVFADRIIMVPAQKLAKGRIALLGDAGYCPTFFSGMGAAAALLGAYTLARQIGRQDAPGALAAYESIMVPLVAGYQRTAVGGPGRTMARGSKRLLRDFITAAMPEKLGGILSRRRYQADVTMAELD